MLYNKSHLMVRNTRYSSDVALVGLIIFSLFPFFSVPAPPTNLKVTFSNHTHITFEWDPPVNASTKVMYSVKLRSDFWGHFFSKKVPKETYTFAELKSGTKYDFEVQTVVGTLSSPMEKLSQCTGETFWTVIYLFIHLFLMF